MKWSSNKFKYEDWHKWFAWHPVKLENGDKIWLEFVLRKQRDLSIEYDWFERVMFMPYFDYKESVFDLLK
jgi:hypothetical protein